MNTDLKTIFGLQILDRAHPFISSKSPLSSSRGQAYSDEIHRIEQLSAYLRSKIATTAVSTTVKELFSKIRAF